MNGARREPWDCCLVINTGIDTQYTSPAAKRKQNVISWSQSCVTGNVKRDEEWTRMSKVDKKYMFSGKMNQSKLPPSLRGLVI